METIAAMSRLVQRVGAWVLLLTLVLVGGVVGIAQLTPSLAIAYTTTEGLYITDVRSTVRLRVTDPGVVPTVAPVWSPDGEKIAFWASRYATSYFYVVDLAGNTHERHIVQSAAGGIDWSPDSSRVIFPMYSARSSAIAVLDTTDGELMLVTPEPAQNAHPVWSPDGTRFVYTAHSREVVIDESGTQRTLTHEDVRNIGAWILSWSPDGSHILMQTNEGFFPDLWLADVSTGELTKLTQNTEADFGAVWSPDGESILYSSIRGIDIDIYLLNPSSGDEVGLTQLPTSDAGASWSPDGTQIAFISHRDNTPELYLMNPDGSGQRRLTFDNIPAAASNGLSHFYAWSPDGRTIVYRPPSVNLPDLYLVDVRTGIRTNLTHNPPGVESFWASWRPNTR